MKKLLDYLLSENIAPSEGTEIAFLGDGETEVELIDTYETELIDLGHDISMGFHDRVSRRLD